MTENNLHTPEDGGNATQEPREVSLLGGTRFGKWLENFWYHYKVSFLAVVFLLAVITVCVVQCATRPKEADIKLCYAGGTSMMASSTNTVLEDSLASLSPFLPHGTEDADMLHYFIDRSSTDPSVQSISQTNLGLFRDELALANAYIYLLDESLYLDYAPAGDAHYMREIAPLLGGSTEGLALTADGRGVYLRSTPLASLPGFSSLPEDTVLCLRVAFSAFETNNSEDAYNKSEALFIACLTGTN